MKKYLNSVEEVVKALKAGIKVYCTDGGIYQIVDGFIIEYRSCGTKLVNSAIEWVEHGFNYYTEEPEPLKFEVNRVYKNRENNKVFLDYFEKNEIFFTNYKIGYITDLEGVAINGNKNLDIVGYWEEEK